MKKQLMSIIAGAQIVVLGIGASAMTTHRVVRGDTMWKISSEYGVKTSDIISANPHIENPDVIYPGDIINIPATDGAYSSYEAEVVRLVNKVRAENGLKALIHDESLSRVARIKSQDMKDNGYFSHQSPTYGSPFDMMKTFGISYRSAAENIAKGQRTPEAVVNAWMNSSGHRKNILSASYTHIGVGYVSSGNYWTQLFAGR